MSVHHLLQGLVICGKCGRRMSVGYRHHRGEIFGEYRCMATAIQDGARVCQRIVAGRAIDTAVETLLLGALTPLAVEAALAVTDEITAKAEQADRLRQAHVVRAAARADLARRRYLAVGPGNRLVADTLETDWNTALHEARVAKTEYEAAAEQGAPMDEQITVHVRLTGGQIHTLNLVKLLRGEKSWQTHPDTVALIDELLDHRTHRQIAVILNGCGILSGKGRRYTELMVRDIRDACQLTHRFNRLRAQGLITFEEYADAVGTTAQTVKIWRRNGLINGIPFNDKNGYLFTPPGPDAPGVAQGVPYTSRRLPGIEAEPVLRMGAAFVE